ncbi:hypothetical protein HJA86_35770 [Rhizobium bangladeshense]|nr:hypothetical protein [Rhizobium bangladeshense]
MFCNFAKEFEAHCAKSLQSGIEIAELSRAAFGSRTSSAMHEPSLTQHLMFKLHELGSNRLRVLLPQEKFTGGDIEIHMLLPGNKWIGLIIQAKRVDLDKSGRYEILELGHNEGQQYADLIAFADSTNMLPCYMFFLPEKAAGVSPNRSGAMICNADQLATLIQKRPHLLKDLLQYTRKFSTFLCCLDEDKEHELTHRLAKIFVTRRMEKHPRMPGMNPPPDYIVEFMNTGKIATRWRSKGLGVATIDLRP